MKSGLDQRSADCSVGVKSTTTVWSSCAKRPQSLKHWKTWTTPIYGSLRPIKTLKDFKDPKRLMDVYRKPLSKRYDVELAMNSLGN